MRIRSLIVSAAVVVVALCMARPAFAQDDEMRGDFAVGYSVLRDSGLSQTFPAGFVLAITGDVNPKIRIVGEFGGNFKNVDTPTARVRVGIVTYQGGIRLVPVTETTIRPLVQILAGGANLRGTVLGAFNVSDSDNGFAYQPGAGVDMRLSRLLDGRAQVDYRSIHSGGESVNEYRFAFSVVIPFGRK